MPPKASRPAPAPVTDAPQRAALDQALVIANHLFNEIKIWEKAKAWPDIPKRNKGQDDNESQEDLDKYVGKYRPGESDVSDPTTSEEVGSDDPLDRAKNYDPADNINRYVPFWCAPNYRDVRRTRAAVAVSVTGNPTKVITVRRDLPHLIMRPAVLDKDKAKNPTLYAKRFGMDPDAPTSRSRFSPTISATRRVPVEGSVGHTGIQQYVGMAELDNACKNGVDALLDEIEASDPMDQHHEELMALKTLLEMVSDDHTYQRAVLNMMSTDERRKLKIHDPEEPDLALDSDLEGPLHPLLDLVRWGRTRTVAPTITPYYDLGGGVSGEWTVHAQDQRVWMALQAPLQLASRILEIHPMYHTIWDPFNRRPVAAHRLAPASEVPDHHNADYPPMYIHQDVDSRPLLRHHQDEVAFKKTGYDVSTRIYELLRDRLEFQIADVCEREAVGDSAEPYGVTYYPPDADVPTYKITVALPPFNIWPLMHPEYTRSEKGVLARFIAGVILHELGHASHCAVTMFMRPKFINARPDLDTTNKQRLASIAQELFPSGDKWDLSEGLDPWLNDEPQGEIGFALENQIFGGTLSNSAWWNIVTYRALGDLHFIQPSVEAWPNSRMHHGLGAQGKGDYGYEFLVDPPVPTDRMHKISTVPEQTKYFQQSFWDVEVAKYGPTAILLYADGEPRIAVAEFSHRDDNALTRVFGTDTAETLEKTVKKLANAGYSMCSKYISELQIETSAEPLELERWILYFARRPFYDSRINQFTMHFNLLKEDITYIEAETEPDNQKIAFIRKTLPFTPVSDMQEYQVQLKESKARVKKVIMQQGRAFHVLMLAQLEEAQLLVLRLFMMPKKGRDAVQNRFLQSFQTNVSDKYINSIKTIKTVVESVYHAIRNTNLHNTPDYQDLINHIPDFLKVVTTTSNSFGDVYARFSVKDRIVQGVDETVPQFTAVATRRAFRFAKLLEHAACKEIWKMPKLIRAVMDKAIELIFFHTKKNQGRMHIKTDLLRVRKFIQAAKSRDLNDLDERDLDYYGYSDIVDLMRSQKLPAAPAPVATYFKPAKDPDAMSIDSTASSSSSGSPMLIDSTNSAGKATTSKPTPAPAPPPTPRPPANHQLPTGVSKAWIEDLFGGKKLIENMAANKWTYHVGPTPAGPPKPIIRPPKPPKATPKPKPKKSTAAPGPSPPKKHPFDQAWKPSSSDSASDEQTHLRPKKKARLQDAGVTTEKVRGRGHSSFRKRGHEDDRAWRPNGQESSSSDDWVDNESAKRRRTKRARGMLRS